MKTALYTGLIVSVFLVQGCGQVVIDGSHGRSGSAGQGGTSGDGGSDQGGDGLCGTADCSGDGTSCSCVTTCPGTKLRADCQYKGDTLVCECHKDANYMGTCGESGGPACSLPGGCCEDYL